MRRRRIGWLLTAASVVLPVLVSVQTRAYVATRYEVWDIPFEGKAVASMFMLLVPAGRLASMTSRRTSSHLAATARLPEKLVVQTALETVERFHEKWKTEQANLPLSKRVIDAIDAHLAIVPLGRRRTVASAPSW